MFVGTAHLEVTTASIYRVVTNSTSGVVAGATLTLANLGTGAAAAKVTDADGSLVLDFLRVGMYRLKIRAPGFRCSTTSRSTERMGVPSIPASVRTCPISRITWSEAIGFGDKCARDGAIELIVREKGLPPGIA